MVTRIDVIGRAGSVSGPAQAGANPPSHKHMKATMPRFKTT
jgi:hypothetical protein